MKRENFKTVDFMGIRLAQVTVEEFLRLVIAWARGKEKRLITYVNAHCTNMYFRNSEYQKIIDQADLVYADGQAIVWTARLLGSRLPERVNAGDFLLQFCQQCRDEGLSLYLLGSKPGVAETTMQRLEEEIPGLKVTGTQHGFFAAEEDALVIEKINQAGPDIVLVGMGVPYQERWLQKSWPQLVPRVYWCVGALFEYYSGRRARAPRWLRRMGLEWAFRLVLEPQRLWGRYILGNTLFTLRVLKRLVNKLFK